MANMSLEECYRVLELPVGATLVEAQAAYRKLVRVWHPDKFATSPDLKADAEAKLKKLNAAIEVLEDALQERSDASESSPETFSESVNYRGGDPRLSALNLAKRVTSGGRASVVEVSNDGITLVIAETDEINEAVRYARQEIVRVYVVEDSLVAIHARDPEGIVAGLIQIDLQFRNDYFAHLFVKRAASFGIKTGQNSPGAKQTASHPSPEGQARSRDSQTERHAGSNPASRTVEASSTTTEDVTITISIIAVTMIVVIASLFAFAAVASWFTSFGV